MAEIALRTTERKVQKAKYLAWRPIGSAMIAQSDHTICRKWLEICCDLVSPKKRETYRNIPGWTRLCEAWTPELREAWLEADRPTPIWKLSRLLEDHTFSAMLWDSLIVPIGVTADLPLAPESDMPVHRTWLWSEGERKRYFIVVNTDADSPTVDNWNGHDQYDGATGLVLPQLAEGEVRDPKIKVVISPRRQCKYRTDIGLSAATLLDIANMEKIKNPRFDKPVSKDKIKQPLVEDRDDQ
ncbi:MAG: hypothetical protein IMZ50_16825 [Candidatus Atribacteria bacterium]|nr:hypothetical protein [Candidatus Atribacteria bacterium]